MAFLPTEFIYPIDEPICINQEENFWIDNPNEEELEEIILYLQKLVKLGRKGIPPFIEPTACTEFRKNKRDSDDISIEDALLALCKRCKISKKVINWKKPIEELAKRWVIFRCPGKNKIYEMRKLQEENPNLGQDELFFKFANKILIEMKNDNTDDNIKKLKTFTYLFNAFQDWDHLIKFYIDLDDVKSVENAVYICIGNDYIEIESMEPLDFLDQIKKHNKQINALLENTTECKKIDLICEYLQCIDKDRTGYASIVLLVSIIELLLINKPDADKFNIEQSITKQFVLKLSVVLDKMSPELLDYKNSQKQFKEIYNLRSNIAHGSFELKDSSKISKFKGILQTYVKILLKLYIQDLDYVNYIKNC